MNLEKPGAAGPDPAYVYSTQLVAAWLVNKHFYNDTHFCYCSPDFGNRPTSSSPKGLLLTALAELAEPDRGGQVLIREKLATIRRVAEEKLRDDPLRLKDCTGMLDCFGPKGERCYPVVYVIDWKKVRDRAVIVPWADRASLWSAEVKIVDLRPLEFAVLSFA